MFKKGLAVLSCLLLFLLMGCGRLARDYHRIGERTDEEIDKWIWDKP